MGKFILLLVVCCFASGAVAWYFAMQAMHEMEYHYENLIRGYKKRLNDK